MIKEFSLEDKNALSLLTKIMITIINDDLLCKIEDSIFNINNLDNKLLTSIEYFWDDNIESVKLKWNNTVYVPSKIKNFVTYPFYDNSLVCLLFWAEQLFIELLHIAAHNKHPIRYMFNCIWTNYYVKHQDNHLFSILRNTALGLLGCVVSYLDIQNSQSINKADEYEHVKVLFPKLYDYAKQLVDIYN